MKTFINAYNEDPSVGHLSTPVTTSKATKIYLNNLPAYRVGLSPLLRGLEVGMAHGYLLLGPFAKLGPLRDSPNSLMAGLLSALGLILILTVCLAMYGKVTFQESERVSDENKGLSNGKNWSQFTSGFFIGSSGGAGFAYLVLINLM